MTAKGADRTACRTGAWLALLTAFVLFGSPARSINVLAVTVDHRPNGVGPWNTNIPTTTVIHTGDWVRVNLLLENDTGLLGNAIVDVGPACCLPGPDTCPPVPATQTLIAITDGDCVANNDGTKGEWPSQYWIWPYAPAPAQSSGYYPASAAAPLSLVSADPTYTFAYNGYSYSSGLPHDTASVSWVFRLDQAASNVDLDLVATDQDDNPTCSWNAPTEGSWQDASFVQHGDGTAHGILSSVWGSTLNPLPAVTVVASAGVTSPGTRPANTAYIGDTVEIRADATNPTAADVVVDLGGVCLTHVVSGSFCPQTSDPACSCLADATSPGSPALPATIPAGSTVTFKWTEVVYGKLGCSLLGGCTAGGSMSGSGSVTWTTVVAAAPANVTFTIQPGPLAITASAWVDPDGDGLGFIPLGVIAPGSSEAGRFYYMGMDVIETRFTYRNTGTDTFAVTPQIDPGSTVTSYLVLDAGPNPAGAQTLGPGASVTVAWRWKRKSPGGLDGCRHDQIDFDFTTSARGNCPSPTITIQGSDLPFHPYDVCGTPCAPGSRGLTVTAPPRVDEGGPAFSVVLHATNMDSRPFVLDPAASLWKAVAPGSPAGTVTAAGPDPPLVNAWSAGETKDFVWSWNPIARGKVRFQTGIEFPGGPSPCHLACRGTMPYCEADYAEVWIVAPGDLRITSFTASPAVSCAKVEGGLVLQMGLENKGVDCLRVKGFCSPLGYPDPQPMGHAWDAASPPAPAASPNPAVGFTIQPGATQLVTWYMNTNCPDLTSGKIWFGCDSTMVTAESIDCGTKAVIDPAVTADWTGPPVPPVTMTQQAFLSASVWTDNSRYSVGQVITVYLSVSNEGGNAANGFTASVTPATFAGASALPIAGPIPAVPATYPGSGSCTSAAPYVSNATFIWQYTAAAAGFVSFTGAAKGTDTVCSLPLLASFMTPKVEILSAAGLDCAVLPPAVPVVTMRADCATCMAVSVCEPDTGRGCLDFVMAASNLGGVTVVNVTVSQASAAIAACAPGACAATGGGTVACPAPVCEPAETVIPGELPEGATHQYTWRYSPTALGCVRAHVWISGNDAATGNPLLSSDWGPCIRIVPRYPVELSILSAPAQVAPGQRFTVTVHACNPGETSAALQSGQPALEFTIAGSPVTEQYDLSPAASGVIPAHECRDIAVAVTPRRDATPGVVTIRVPAGAQYIAVDSETGLPVAAVDRGTPWSITVCDPRSRLVVTGPHPVHVLREPALLEYVLADAGRGNGRLTLRIYTLTGESVRTLVDKAAVIEDVVVPWDGRNASGQVCASGVYLARLDAPGFSATAKVAIVK